VAFLINFLLLKYLQMKMPVSPMEAGILAI